MLPPNSPGCFTDASGRTIDANIYMPLAQQMVSMQAAHDTFVAIQQVLAVFIQFLETVVQRVERQSLNFDAGQFEGSSSTASG